MQELLRSPAPVIGSIFSPQVVVMLTVPDPTSFFMLSAYLGFPFRWTLYAGLRGFRLIECAHCMASYPVSG